MKIFIFLPTFLSILFNPPNKPIIQHKNIVKTNEDFSTLTSEIIFKKAITIYTKAKSKKDYIKSAKMFEILVNRGIKHESLFYNLGNAYFKAEQYGNAIYNYERALKLNPSYSDANYNLKTAKQVVAMKFKDSVVDFNKSKLWFKIVNWLSLHSLSIIFLILWTVFFSLLTYFYFLKKSILKLTLIITSTIIGIALLIFSLLFAGRLIYEKSYKYGIILPMETEAKEAPQSVSNSSFKIHAGFKVMLGTEERSWIKVILPNGMEGWIEKKNIGRL